MRVRCLAIVVFAAFFSACSSNPHKAEKIDTEMENSRRVMERGEEVGVKDGDLVVQKKVLMAEDLRRLQNGVYTQEDLVYGNRKYGSRGLYGVLKDCRLKLSDKKYGGTGKLKWTEPIARVTEKEEDFQLGVDENNEVVGVSEEFLKDRIARFRKYKLILEKREDEYRDKIDICEAELRSRMHDIEKQRENNSAASLDN